MRSEERTAAIGEVDREEISASRHKVPAIVRHLSIV
jgi:hypothetical protein